MFLISNLSKSKSIPAILIGFSCIISLCHEVNGLSCHTCYPCADDAKPEDMPSTPCNEAAYQSLPDTGYHGCSYEIGAGNSRRRRCVWLRHDPDNPDDKTTQNRPQRCSLSPFDDVSYDCYCFTDNCNLKAMEHSVTTPGSTGSGQPGEPSGPDGSSFSRSSNTKPMNLGILSSALGITVLQIIWKF